MAQLLLWLDLETTGLDPVRDSILEVGWGLTSLTHPFVIREPNHRVLQWNGDVTRLHPIVKQMHTRNGLLEECSKSLLTVSTVIDVLMHEIPIAANDKVILAGSSVHFDLAFLKVHMPYFAERLSHRLYDVSAIKLFCQGLGMPPFPKGEAHRAKDDILESIDHAKKCATWLRVPVAGPWTRSV